MMNARISRLFAATVLWHAAPAAAADFAGSSLSPLWAIPFVGLLLSIAVMPLVAPLLWHRHYGKITAAWALAFLLPFAAQFGTTTAIHGLGHALFGEYIPFILLLTALFTVSGGIYVSGNLRGSPGLNASILAIGTLLASFMGTTGASMLLIRPLIRANDNRRHQAHVIVFFIILVSNVGGALTPLGDPPLFLGFLKGVDFFWTMRNIFPETLLLVVALLAIFFGLDSWLYRREGVLPVDPTPNQETVGVTGLVNFILLGGVVGLVLLSGVWKSDVSFDVMGAQIGLPGLVRDTGLVAITLISLRVTPAAAHLGNQFGWAPMSEVAKLFAGIFVTIIPVIEMLRAGTAGAFSGIVAAVTGPDGTPEPAMYFWATGLLSAFLDNAPTYLVFFNLAGGDPQELMTTLAPTLAAISAGAVFMGALTYIGNAPNLMVKSIAEDRGIRMPSFFGYMAWSMAALLPLLVVVTLIWRV
jgi:Na+/H+ antiporter NhaD/arsenite permease-like protein